MNPCGTRNHLWVTAQRLYHTFILKVYSVFWMCSLGNRIVSRACSHHLCVVFFIITKKNFPRLYCEWISADVLIQPYDTFYFSFPVQFSSVTQSCLTLCDPMKRSMPGLPVHHQLPESTQTPIHWVGDDIPEKKKCKKAQWLRRPSK